MLVYYRRHQIALKNTSFAKFITPKLVTSFYYDDDNKNNTKETNNIIAKTVKY